MRNIIKTTAILAAAVAFLYQQNNISTLARTIETQQYELDSIRDEIVTGYVKSTLALKMSMANKSSIRNIHQKTIVNVTAYSPNENETDSTPYHTASNRRVRNGIVAVSRDLFDQGWVFGRKIYIKSLGVYTIDDLMADSQSNQIDIFMFDPQQALLFGKKVMEAHLLAIDPATHSLGKQGISHASYADSTN